MGYAVDFVLDVMTAISSAKPLLFQRDGQLYVVSNEGFGKVSYGLDMDSNGSNDMTSYDALKNGNKFIVNEKAYFDSIAFGPDTRQFTLDDIIKTAQKLSALPDDGKVRMISHNERYHSHKYGYASDGIDVWVEKARVMDKGRYLYNMRENEANILKDLDIFRAKAESNGRSSSSSWEAYNNLPKPDCVIITPNMVVSLPRRISFKEWNENTDLSDTHDSSNNGGISNYNELHMSANSPFGVYVKLCPQSINLMTDDIIVFDTINAQLDQVQPRLSNVDDFIAKLNYIHNQTSKYDITMDKSAGP
jgi:hypothetical protein